MTFLEVMPFTVWKNMVKPDRFQMTIRRMRFACWITEATHTHTHWEYVILIAFPRQKWFRKLASMLHTTYTSEGHISYVITHTHTHTLVTTLEFIHNWVCGARICRCAFKLQCIQPSTGKFICQFVFHVILFVS
jgi:hypothetical protein